MNGSVWVYEFQCFVVIPSIGMIINLIKFYSNGLVRGMAFAHPAKMRFHKEIVPKLKFPNNSIVIAGFSFKPPALP